MPKLKINGKKTKHSLVLEVQRLQKKKFGNSHSYNSIATSNKSMLKKIIKNLKR